MRVPAGRFTVLKDASLEQLLSRWSPPSTGGDATENEDGDADADRRATKAEQQTAAASEA